MAMKKEITLGNLLSILAPVFVLLITWGISMTSRQEAQDIRIDSNEIFTEKNAEKIEKVDDKMDENFKIVVDKLDRMLYKINEQKK